MPRIGESGWRCGLSGRGHRYYGIVNIVAFIISLALFVAGFYVMGSAFYVEGAEFAVFMGGILMTCLGVFIPIHVLKRIDG